MIFFHRHLESSQERIEKAVTELQGKFCDIVDPTYDHILREKICVGPFIARLTNLQVEVHKEFLEKIVKDFNKDSTVDEVWLQLTAYWNFLNYFKW